MTPLLLLILMFAIAAMIICYIFAMVITIVVCFIKSLTPYNIVMLIIALPAFINNFIKLLDYIK